jgi:cAMP phosphodiesterase
MKLAHFNPTTFAIDDVPLDVFTRLQSIVEEAHGHQELNDAGNQNISVRGGQQIQLVPNEFNLNTDLLKTYIESRCQQFVNSIMQQSARIDLNVYQPCLISAWTIKQGPNQYQATHSHEAHISGNIYIEVPDLAENSDQTDGCLEFRLPVIRNSDCFIFVDQWRFKPQICKMVIFPSYVPHTVYPWRGQGNRTVLAWDVKLIQK